MSKPFEDANMATETMFKNNDSEADVQSNAPQSNTENESAETPTAEAAQQETPAQNVSAESQTLDDATKTAEIAAQAASEKDAQLQQAMQEIEALKQQNQQLQGTVDEISRSNENKIIENALEAPTLDISGLAFSDEETQQNALKKFAEEMAAFNRQQIMQELTPAIEYAKKGMHEAEKAEVIDSLSKIPELSGIKDMLPQLDGIIANNKWLQSEDMPADERYINAFAMAKGVNSINTPPAPPKEPTTEELLAMYNSNPELQQLIERQRIEQIKNSQQVPPLSASSGAVNAALDIKKKPETLDEASERTNQMFEQYFGN